MSQVYLNEDPELCVCRGAGEYWAVGEPGQCSILNVFCPYRDAAGRLVQPDFSGLVQLLLPCRYHGTGDFSSTDAEMLQSFGIAAPGDIEPPQS